MDWSRFPSPCYVVDLGKLRGNLELLREVQERASCKIVLALKGFAMWSLFPLIRESLPGICASGPWEARLGREEFGGEVLTYAVAYTDADIEELLPITDHLDFNSLNQWMKFKHRVQSCGRDIRCGLRINPECSTQEVAIYDPCVAGSRLGITADQLSGADLAGITGFHFHTLCEQNADALEKTLSAVEARFSQWLPQLEWFNMGGGHHITRGDYEVERLVKLVREFGEKWGVEVYLEPGEAIALNTGVLVASVLDVVHNEMDVAILDVSATAHMPDILEMPYRPEITGAGKWGEKAHAYRLGGLSCLAGDVIGDYAFDAPLQPGDRLVFEDMAHYTMVKTTTFNGVKHPAIASYDPRSDEAVVVRKFAYEDYRDRLS